MHFPHGVRRRSLGVLAVLIALFAVSISYSYAFTPTATLIGDLVWREGRYSHNGIQDPGEPGLGFAPVNIYQGSTLVAVTNANSAGIYSLNVETVGSYTIEMPIPSYTGVGLLGSPQNAGGDPTRDSNVAVSNRRAAITVTAANDSTIDGGVYDRPDSVTYCTGRQLTFTDWSDTFSLLKADPSYGVLTGVYLRASVGSTQNATLTNNDTASQVFSYIGGALSDVTLPDGTVVSTQTGRRVNNIALAPGGNTVLNNLVDYRTSEYEVFSTDFPLYMGDGGFDDYFTAPAQAQGVTTVIGGGNIVAVAQTRAYTTLCVTYVFEVPLSAELSSFEAQCRQESAVDVTWETVSEPDTLGFNVLRATSATDTPVQVNTDLIAAQSPGGGGSSYTWEDLSTKSDGDYFYWLDALDIHGNPTRHGPVSATVPCTPTAVSLSDFDSSSVTPSLALWVLGGTAVAVGTLGVLLRRRKNS